MKCLLVLLASSLVLASAQFLNVDPSATNDYDLNRLISQVLNQAAAIQPEFTFEPQASSASTQQQSASQNQYVTPTRNPDQFGPLQRQEGTNQIRDQYRAPEPQRQVVPEPQRPIQENSRPNIVRNEYTVPAQQSIQNEPRREYGTPNRQTQVRKEYNTPKKQVRNEYNIPARNNQRNGYNNEPAVRQTPILDEFGAPEQQELKEFSDIESEANNSPSQRSSFAGRSQQRGYAANSRQSVRTNSVSNDLATASSGGYYRDSQRITPGGYSENINSFNGGPEVGEIKKFVYIHTAPPELQQPPRPRLQKVKAPAPETHYNIIFVKAPSPPREEPQEIELPAPPQQKTLVYVLLKKPLPPPEIRIPAPPPTQPSKPEVYFIRYSDNKGPQINDDQGPLPYDEEADLGHNNRLAQPTEFYGTPRNNGDGGYNNNNNDFVENNVGAYSEQRKVSNAKKSLSKGKSSQKSSQSSHYIAPGSRPFETQSKESAFRPVSKKAGSLSRNQSSSGGY